MTNPTLVTADATWAGWTQETILDEILRPFGLTNDSTKDRVIASTDEVELARNALRLAITYLHAKYPSVWSKRIYSVTWTADDHSIILPAGTKLVERVFYGGLPLTSLTMEDRTRFTQSDAEGGGWKTTAVKPQYYYISGIVDNDAAGGDWRMALRLINTPGTGFDTETLIVHYTSRAPALLSATDTQHLSLDPLFHDWLANRAVEIMATKMGPAESIKASAMVERSETEHTIFLHMEGTGEFPDRVRWEYPPLADSERR